MKGILTKLAAAAAGMGLAATAAALPTELTSTAYRVTVDGRAVDVLGVPAPTMHDAQLPESALHPYFAAFFEATNEVAVTVESDDDLTNARLLPSALGLRPTRTSRGAVTFRARPPFLAVVEPTGRDRALVISAKAPMKDAPRPDAKGVRFFAPGRYHFEKPLRLTGGETLYLAPGAVVEAAVDARGDNIRICGHGILSGLPWEWRRGPFGNQLCVSGRNNVIEGITILGSFHWTLVLRNCENTLVDGVNILNGRVLNDDGIDVCHSRATTIRNCFVRSQDDCIAPKYWCEGLTVENCTLWTDVANIIRIGYECIEGRKFSDFTFRGINVLHQSVRKTRPGEFWSENAVYVQSSNGMLSGNMLFEDFRFDNPEPGDNFACIRTQRTVDEWQQHKTAGDVDGVTFRNVTFPNGLPAGSEAVWIENLQPGRRLENVRFENVEGPLPMTVKGKVGAVKTDWAAKK